MSVKFHDFADIYCMSNIRSNIASEKYVTIPEKAKGEPMRFKGEENETLCKKQIRIL